VIHTPKNEMLKGITRKQVLSMAAENKMDVVERDMHLDELPSMAGAFLTATTKGVLPVTKIDDQMIGNGDVHPIAKKLQSLYEDRVDQYLAKALQTQ
jgi:branched-subunit amino acid aminotransferase/4-amino-4-deoxychorismate lyase